MDFTTYISAEMLILVPVLYCLGMFIKASEIKDKYIPVMLLTIAIICAIIIADNYTAAGIINSFIQGVLTSGTAVFVNQLVVQSNK